MCVVEDLHQSPMSVQSCVTGWRPSGFVHIVYCCAYLGSLMTLDIITPRGISDCLSSFVISSVALQVHCKPATPYKGTNLQRRYLSLYRCPQALACCVVPGRLPLGVL